MLAVLVAKTAIAEPFYVPSGSMEPTLLIGDELLATKFPYGYSTRLAAGFHRAAERARILGALPERGDVVVFRWPGDRSQIWVKRVIGLPGDRIALRDGRLWINGEPVGLRPTASAEPETEDGVSRPGGALHRDAAGRPRASDLQAHRRWPLDNMPEVVVPPGPSVRHGRQPRQLRRQPRAGRAGGVGMLPVDDLVGRVDALVGSWDLGVKDQPIWTWPSGLRLSRFFTAVH